MKAITYRGIALGLMGLTMIWMRTISVDCLGGWFPMWIAFIAGIIFDGFDGAQIRRRQ